MREARTFRFDAAEPLSNNRLEKEILYIINVHAPLTETWSRCLLTAALVLRIRNTGTRYIFPELPGNMYHVPAFLRLPFPLQGANVASEVGEALLRSEREGLRFAGPQIA